MPESITDLSRQSDLLKEELVGRVEIRRFFFVMRALAKENLWSEAKDYLADHGYTDVMISSEPVALLQQLLREKLADGRFVGKRGQRFVGSISCFGGHPTPPPKSPSPSPSPPDGGGGGGDGGGGGGDGGGGDGGGGGGEELE